MMASFGGQHNNDNVSTGGDASSGLRQPKPDTINHMLHQLHNSNSSGSGSSKLGSNLSADAKEFVPKSFSGYNKPVLSASAPEFVPRFSSDALQNENEFDPVLVDFKQTLMILNTQPGNVEEYMKPVCERFRHNVTSAEQMTEIIDILFLQSVQESNFRYTGARICQHICANLKENTIFSKFRHAFLTRCKQEYERREIMLSDPNLLDLLTGFTLFMGELFLNVQVINSEGNLSKMHILPTILTDLMLTMLSQPSKITVKCTCQLLKLVGASMEDCMREMKLQQNQYDEVFSHLERAMQSNTIDENMKFLIKTVLNLRQNNWGRPESTTSSLEGSSGSLNRSLPYELQQNEPVFYNNSGQTISREEAGFYDETEEYILNDDEERMFLQWQAESNNPPGTVIQEGGYENYPVGENEPEMDEEMEEAFEEFLRSQPPH